MEINIKKFQQEALMIHRGKYDYSLIKKIPNKSVTKLNIKCKTHGIFKKTYRQHIKKKQGCPRCAYQKAANLKKIPQDTIIKQFKEKHGDKYDYSLVKYRGIDNKVTIICPEHGKFEQSPYNHRIWGCAKCAGVGKLSKEEVIMEFKKIHGNFYNYDKVNYISDNKKIIISCPNHGDFKQQPNGHKRGQGCPKCKGMGLTKKEKIKLVSKIHNNKYDYSLIKDNKINHNKKYNIICPKHGKFQQVWNNHYNMENSCPYCNSSKGENNIRKFLIEENILYEEQYIFKDCKYKYPLRFDFYIPLYNLCIEYDGIQHFKPVKFFGGKKAFLENQLRDKIKNEFCKINQIKLIRINYKQDIIKELNKFKKKLELMK